MTRSEIFVWIGSAGIFLSAAIGIVAVFFPSSWLIITSLALGGISAPAAIVSARYAAREQQKQFEQEQRARQGAFEAERREREKQIKQEEEQRKKGLLFQEWSMRTLVPLAIVIAPGIKNLVDKWMFRLNKPQR